MNIAGAHDGMRRCAAGKARSGNAGTMPKSRMFRLRRSLARGGLVFLAIMASVAVARADEAAEAPANAGAAIKLRRALTYFAIHKDYDRLAVKFARSETAICQQDGSLLRLRITPSAEISGNPVSGRRMLSLARGQSEAAIQLAPEARARVWHGSGLLVIDVFDPKAPVTGGVSPGAKQAARNGPAPAASPDSTPTHNAEPKASVAALAVQPSVAAAGSRQAATPPAVPAPPDKAGNAVHHVATATNPPGAIAPGVAPEHPVDDPAGTPAPVSVTLLREADASGTAMLVPFGRDVGAAAFVRGDEARVVFDTPRSFDLSSLENDATFSSVTEQLLPDGMQLRFRLAVGAGLRLTRRVDGWVVSVQRPGQQGSQLSPIIGQNRKRTTAFSANAAGRVVVMTDDVTGGRLLVGTQRADGQHIAGPHRSAEAVILPTWQGVVVQPISDRVVLSSTPAGFELSSGDAPLAMIWSNQQTGAWPDGRTMTRVFEFADAPLPELHRRLGQALRDAAVTPKLARLAPRLIVAQAMLGQGLDVEAAAVLQAAQSDDPAGYEKRGARRLAALASWLSARAAGSLQPNMAPGSDDFGDSDEAELLKALFRPAGTDLAHQAATVASTWPLLSNYPPLLRRFMLEPAADILFRGGQHKALEAFLAAFPDASLDVARGNLLRSEGKFDDAVKIYDRAAGGRDRLARANALEQTVSLKLERKHLSPASAAEALNQQLYAWRGGDRELRVRQLVAKLRAEAGEWRSAFSMLNETAENYPQARAEIHAAKAGMVTELLKGDSLAKLNAADLVAIADAASDVLDGNELGIGPALIDKLLALDLSARADPILRRLFENAKDARNKAELGLRLAQLQSDEGDPAAGLAALAVSDNAELGGTIEARRSLLRARLLARTGKPAQALEALAILRSVEASELTASIREGQHDWAEAVQVLKPLLFDAGGSLPVAARRALILRLARDETQAGDQAGLRLLHDTQAAQFEAGPDATLFAVLTAEPVRSTADLPRSSSEARAMKALPALIARSGAS